MVWPCSHPYPSGCPHSLWIWAGSLPTHQATIMSKHSLKICRTLQSRNSHMLLVVVLIPLTGRQSNQFTTWLFRFNSIQPKHQSIRKRQRPCLLINNVPAVITRPRPACSFHSLARYHMLLSTLKLHRRICKGLSVFLPMLRSTQSTDSHSNFILCARLSD